MGVDGVLHGQRVQSQLPGYRGELFLGGRVEPDPRQPASLPAKRLAGIYGGEGFGRPVPVHVEGAVHDHGPLPLPSTTLDLPLEFVAAELVS